MGRFTSSRRRLRLAAFVLPVFVAGGVAYAAIPDSSGTIHACYAKSGGALRVIDSAASCKSGETSLNWSQQGVPGPAGPAGPTGPVGPAGPGSLFAVVGADGTLARGSAGVTAAHLSAGAYQVDLGKDVSGCAYVASPGATNAATVPASMATVATRAGNTNAAFVEIFDLTGAAHDEPFHLIVAC